MRWDNPVCDELLRRSIEGGHTFARICGIFAEELGIELGRNAVIGRAFRLGLVIPKRPKKDKPPRRRRRRIGPSVECAADLHASAEPCDTARAIPVSLWDLRYEHCRYPNEDASLYCGAPKADGSSYCEAHHRICYIKSSWHG